MISADLRLTALLNRKAVVYVRQSQARVQSNLESRRRQYELVEIARQRVSATSK
ncbi:MAG TPA: hypothetical protein VL985_02070 [Stellaceae bacterium]|nr:hypothetical protein [Stellaceae bacterium]